MTVDRDNPLPGIPHVESPFFDELFNPADPIYPIARSLNERGYAIIQFPDPEIATLADTIRTNLHDRYDWAGWHDKGLGLRLQDAWQFEPAVKAIAVNQTILALLERLYGRPAFPFQTLNFPIGSQQHFHSDSVHFSSRPERFMCGVWVALEDVGPDQGPLLYYPGSHSWPIYTREHIGEAYYEDEGAHQATFEPMWRKLVERRGIAPEVFHARKGQALIWAANLLHGGMPHRNRALTRWSQVTHYYFADCTYYTPLNSNEPLNDVDSRQPFDIRTGSETRGAFLGTPAPKPGTYQPTRPSPRDRVIRVPTGMPPFDPVRYLALNPDVAAAGIDPSMHFDLYGRHEDRRWY
jgi:hypothetical protein